MPLSVFPLKYKISDCSILSACYCTTWWWWSLGDSELTCGQYFPRPLSSPPDKDRVLVVADASVCWRLAGRLHCVEAGAWLRWDWLTDWLTDWPCNWWGSVLTPHSSVFALHSPPAPGWIFSQNWQLREENISPAVEIFQDKIQVGTGLGRVQSGGETVTPTLH